jgi:RNA polymerase sigma-70 factor (ECF subfamily)
MAYELPLSRKGQITFNTKSHQEERLIDQLDSRLENSQSQLVRLTTSDGGESLNELFGDCMPRLYRVADCVLHNSHDSEDALQDGLLSAFRHIDQFKGNSRFSTWLFSIIRNAALAKLRRQRANPILPIDDQTSEDESELNASEAPADSRPDPERACAQSELSYLFARILEGLPPNYRVIIRLCDFEGYSGKEAAQRLGLSVSALKAQHHRARLAIRESMGSLVATKGGYRHASRSLFGRSE